MVLMTLPEFEKKVIKPEVLEDALKVVYILEIILLFMSFILIGNSYSYLKDNVQNQDLFVFSLGMLSFTGIFYSLLAQKDVRDKLNQVWEDMLKREQSFEEEYKKKKEIAKSIGLEEEFIAKTDSQRDYIKRAKQMLKLELFLSISILFYIASSLIALLKVNALWLIFILLSVAILSTLHIAFVWLLITSEEIRGLFSWKGKG